MIEGCGDEGCSKTRGQGSLWHLLHCEVGLLVGHFVVWNSAPVGQVCHSSWTAVTQTGALWTEKVNLYPDQVPEPREGTGYARLEGATRGQPTTK